MGEHARSLYKRRWSLLWLLSALLVCVAPSLLTPSPVQATPRHKLNRAETNSDAATVRIPITVHVPADAGFGDRRHVARSVARANSELEPYGVRLVVVKIEALPKSLKNVTTLRSRRKLARISDLDGTMHVFFTDRLEMWRGRSGDRRVSGMHWRYRGPLRALRDREFMVVSHDAPETTLLHEFGHAFGLNHQQRDPDNVMCSCQRRSDAALTPTQGRHMREAAEKFLTAR